MPDDAIAEAEANIQVLIAEELSVQHRLGGHHVPAPGCRLCRR